MLLIGCATDLGNTDPHCTPEFYQDLRAHNTALLEDGGEQSQITGVVVLEKIDAGCNK